MSTQTHRARSAAPPPVDPAATEFTWNPTKQIEVTLALMVFNRLHAYHYRVYRANDPTRLIDAFDPLAGKYIFLPELPDTP